MTWQDHLRAMRRSWWLVAFLPVMAGIAFYVRADLQDKVYEARSTVVVAPTDTISDPSGVVDALRVLHDGNVLNTLAELLSAQRDPASSPSKRYVRAAVVQQSNLVEVVGTAGDPAAAIARVNNAVTAGTSSFEQLHRVYTVHIVDPTAADDGPVAPHPARDTAVAVLAAFVLAYLFAVAREATRLGSAAEQRRLVEIG